MHNKNEKLEKMHIKNEKFIIKQFDLFLQCLLKDIY